ncbi:hypothetical protein DFJ68_2884 [Terracoccus luteus]|uniref:Uncharacterized protein n=1 Tax=Terracoccus luteus TaxID=53356 RepID=A0A495Y2D0_9MICO|nr:hypothetical protein [Terracoccus luteus]RKT79414.1 hypothetical protein DFJ68_2884 [Terracoccus luteus]
MTDDNSAQKRVFGGDSGPWCWLLPEAWQHAASPELARQVDRRTAALDGDLEDAVAYWNPLLHLTIGGLGWTNVPLGLWRWMEMGRPLDDPLLRTIEDLWGQDLGIFLAWASETDLAKAGLPPELKRACDEWRRDPRYTKWFSGGSDPLHLRGHAPWLPLFPSRDGEAWRRVVRLIPKGSRGAHAVTTLTTDGYVDLFDALANDLVEPQIDGGSRKVALWCPPIGWLGTYRKSRETGLWFRGRHRWHVLGH